MKYKKAFSILSIDSIGILTLYRNLNFLYRVEKRMESMEPMEFLNFKNCEEYKYGMWRNIKYEDK